MQVVQLTSNNVKKYESSIKQLLCIGYIASFDAPPPICYIDSKMEKLHCFLQDGSAVVLGIEAGKDELAGYLWAFVRNTPYGLRLHIQHIAVMPQYQNKGMGNLLLGKLNELAQKQNIDQIELIVSSGNQQALDFYTKRQFTVERYLMTKQVAKHND